MDRQIRDLLALIALLLIAGACVFAFTAAKKADTVTTEKTCARNAYTGKTVWCSEPREVR